MPRSFAFGNSFDSNYFLAQTLATPGAGVGIDDTTQFTAQAANYHFGNNQVSIVAIALYGGQTISLDVDYGVGGINNLNAELWVTSATGTLLATNDNAASTDIGSTSVVDARMSFTAPTTGLYYVAVSQAQNDYTGNFSFDNGGTDTGDFLLNVGFSSLPALHFGTNGDDNDTLTTAQRRYDGLGGSDTVQASAAGSRIDGGAGNDSLIGGNGIDILSGAEGDDTLIGGYSNVKDILVGGPGSDALYGYGGPDELYGGADQDYLYGYDGNDVLWGDDGRDYLYGDNHKDTLRGGDGDDYLYGGQGNDVLVGGKGADEAGYYDATAGVMVDLALTGAQNTQGSGTDVLVSIERLSGSGFGDTLLGNVVANYLSGYNGDDSLAGRGGADILWGSNGNDTLLGGNGNDTLYGETGNDRLVGGNGDDFIDGTDGSDFLVGGPGQDQFYFYATSQSVPGAGRDTIADFSSIDNDRIGLSSIDADSATAGDQAFTYIGGAAFSGTAGELRLATAGGNGYLSGDVDGDSTMDFQILLTGVTTLSATDFYL